MVLHLAEEKKDLFDEITLDELRVGYERFKKVQKILQKVGTYDYVMAILHSVEEKEREIAIKELKKHPPKKAKAVPKEEDTVVEEKVEESQPPEEEVTPPAKTEDNTAQLTPKSAEEIVALLMLSKENEDLKRKIEASKVRQKEVLQERNVARDNLEEIERDVKSLRDETYEQAKKDIQHQKKVLKKEQTDIDMGVL